MPTITVKISQGASEASTISTELSSSAMPDLLSALKTAKEETNAALTKIVESTKDQKPTRKTTNDEDEDSSSEDDNKKLKT